MANISPPPSPLQKTCELFSILGQPVRVHILLLLSKRELCVCHLVDALGLRQANISQQMMILRKAGLVEYRRLGRNLYYRLARPQVAELILTLSELMGESFPEIELSDQSNCKVFDDSSRSPAGCA